MLQTADVRFVGIPRGAVRQVQPAQAKPPAVAGEIVCERKLDSNLALQLAFESLHPLHDVIGLLGFVAADPRAGFAKFGDRERGIAEDGLARLTSRGARVGHGR